MKAHLKAFASVLVAVGFLTGLCFTFFNRGVQQAALIPVRAVEALPEFQGSDLDGKTVVSGTYRGKVLIVNFWASWCGPCVEEIPSFVRLKEALGADLQILAVSNDSTRQDIDIFLKSFPTFRRAGVTIVHDSPPDFPITKQFQVGRLPESFVFSKTGRMVRKVVGTIDWASEDAQGFMKNLISESQEAVPASPSK